jgi:ketosteroid isomerase-like protein
MATQNNAELIRRGYEAFNAGDMATLGELFAEDAVWHVAGNGPLSGKKQGREAILSYFGELGTRSAGTFTATVQDIIAGENHTVALQRSQAESKGRTLDTDGAVAFQLRDGKITVGQEFFEDTAQGDAFWA